MDDFVQDTVDSERDLRRRSRLMPVGIALVILAAFGGVVWFAFSDPGASPNREQTVELIQADPEPVKTKPENPGGMKVEHQDKLILNPDPEKPQVERLLPPPETPLPVTSGNGAPDSGEGGLGGDEKTDVVVTEEAEAESSTLPEDEAKELAAKAESAARSATNGVTAGTSATATIGNASVDKAKAEPEKPDAAPKIPDAPAVKPTPVAPVAEASKPAAPKTATQLAKVPTDSGYILQLASLKSEAIALQEWTRIQNANKGLLAQMKAIVEKAEIDGIGTRYRLQTGPFPTKATAQDLCAQLKAAKQDCLVKRR